MNLPPKKRPGNPILASDWNTLIDALAARTPRPSASLEIISTSGGFSYRARHAAVSEGAASSRACLFGEIITWTEGEGEEAVTKTGIRGGVIYCGDKNFSVPDKEINLETSGVWLIQVSLVCEANRDDDNSLILPGIKTSSASTATMTAKAWTSGTNYDSNTNPTASTGIGTIKLPVGKLTIANGVAKLAATGCGGFHVDQCAGTLSYHRE